MTSEPVCLCGEDDCLYMACGYPYCRSCTEHHRLPECPVDELGRSLNPDGDPWEAPAERVLRAALEVIDDQ